MDWCEVQTRIAAGEGEATEFELWDAYPHQVAVAACALANSDGGLLVLGVSDTRAIQGVAEDPELVQEKMTSLLQSSLSAPIGARLGWSSATPKPVHWMEIRRYRGPEPLRYRAKGT